MIDIIFPFVDNILGLGYECLDGVKWFSSPRSQFSSVGKKMVTKMK